MMRNDPNQFDKGKKPAEKPGDPRSPHSIHFTGSEWKSIKRAAELHGIPAGELVRNGAMAAAGELLDEPPKATLSHGHAALVESVYRMVYVMATLDRGRLIDAGRGKELEDIIAAAHRTMAETMDEGTG